MAQACLSSCHGSYDVHILLLVSLCCHHIVMISDLKGTFSVWLKWEKDRLKTSRKEGVHPYFVHHFSFY